MTNKKYEQLKKVIQEAVPKIMENENEVFDVCPYCESKLNIPISIREPIRLADVFKALEKNAHRVQFSETGKKFRNRIESVGFWMRLWNLTDNNLDHQSDELKELLFNLLVK